jgi:SAM-dependent methyltransferase
VAIGQVLRWRVLPRVLGARRWMLEGRAGVGVLGHRAYIGGRWEEIGRMQFEFMLERGLRPEHVLLDVACGALRGGVHFIEYLSPGHYLGIDKERSLIRRGLAKELPAQVREEKRPEFVISSSFEFERFSKRPDFAIAQSLFSHLTASDIERCLSKLRPFVAPGHEFYATFLAGDSARNPSRSHPQRLFRYEPSELAAMGDRHAWRCEYIGDWGHPRGQVMMRLLPA